MIPPHIIDRLSEIKAASTLRKVPNISPAMGRYLYDMIRIARPERVLEIGTANGYSTLHLALGLTPTARVTTLELSLPAHEEARGYFEELGVALQIDAYHQDALVYLSSTSEIYDFAFIDGYKRLTRDFLLASIPHIRDGGLVIVDDVIKFGHKMVGFFEMLHGAEIPHTILPIDPDDGCLMLVVDS